MNRPILREDAEFILEKLTPLFDEGALFRGERMLLTGATGFFGKWLTQTFMAMEERWQLGNHLVLLTRDRARSLRDSPWLAGAKGIEWIEKDIRELRDCGSFDTILHGAAAASHTLNINQPSEMFDTIVDGTRRVLDLTLGGHCKRLLFVSSGAVYGRQPSELEHVPETYAGAPDPLDAKSAYGEAKRAAELLCASAARARGFHLGIARCYAFNGPYLPLDTHFAAGNFVGSVLKGESLRIGGDGTPLRSYMYPADLMVWLLTVLLKGRTQYAYNVGSDQGVSIRQLAEAVHEVGAQLLPARRQLPQPIEIARSPVVGQSPEKYVPSVERAKAELGLEVWTDLNQGLRKTLRWHLD